MKFGVCGSIKEMLPVAIAAGADYLETNATAVAKMTDEEFNEAYEAVKASPIPVLRANCLFPGDISLHDTSDEGKAKIETHLEKAFSRLQKLGVTKVVFGSGGARRCPDGMDYGQAFRNLVEVCRIIGDKAAKYDIIVVIEPLHRTETNTINSVAEGKLLAAAANHPNIQLLADYYHVVTDNEPIRDIVRVGGVSHVHIASKVGRRYPTMLNAGTIPEFFKALKDLGYDDTISIEGGCDDPSKELKPSLDTLRVIWNMVE